MAQIINIPTYEQKYLPTGKGDMAPSVPGEERTALTVPRSKEEMWQNIVQETEKITKIGERIIEAQNTDEIQKAKLEILKRDSELKDKMMSPEFANENTHDKYVPFHSEEYSKMRGDVFANFKGTSKAKEALGKTFDEYEIQSRSWALGYSQEKKIDEMQVRYAGSSDEREALYTKAALSGDVDLQNKTLASQLEDTQEMIRSRVVSLADGNKRDEIFLENANYTVHMTQIDQASTLGQDLNNPMGMKTSKELLEAKIEQLSNPVENMKDKQRIALKYQAEQALKDVEGKFKILRQEEFLNTREQMKKKVDELRAKGDIVGAERVIKGFEIYAKSLVTAEVLTPVQENSYTEDFRNESHELIHMSRIADAVALTNSKSPDAMEIGRKQLESLAKEFAGNNPNISNNLQLSLRLTAERELEGVNKRKDEKDLVSLQELERDTKNDIAQLYDGKEPNISAREAEIEKLFVDKPEKGQAVLEEYRYNVKIARDAGVFIKRLPTASIEEEAALLKEVEAKKTSDNYADWSKIQDAFVTAVEKKHTHMDKDLAGYTQEVFKTTNPFEMIEHQRKMGVSPSEFSVIPKEEGSTMVKNLRKIATGEERVGAFDIMRKEYGDLMPIVIDDLVKAELPDTLVLLAYMDKPEQREQAIRIAETLDMKDGELTDLVLTASTENITKSDLTDHIDDTTKTEAHDFFTAMQNSFGTKTEVLAEMDRIKRVIFRGTLINVITDGSTVEDATKRAVKAVITDSYTISKDGMYVIPNYTKLNSRRVELVCEGFLNNLKKEDLASGHRNEYNEKEYYRTAKNGRWINAKNFTGLQLVTRSGYEVLDRNENPIVLTWAEIEKGKPASAFLSNTKADMRVVNKLKEVVTDVSKSTIEKSKEGAKSTIEKIKEAPSGIKEGAAFVKKTLEPKEQQEKPLTPGKWKVTEPVVPLEKKVPKSQRPEDWRNINVNP